MSNICKFEIFSYLQKFAILMRWIWKIWVEHNKTDYGSIGGISEVQINYIRLSQYYTQNKFSTCKCTAVFINFHGQITPKWPKFFTRLHGNQILFPKLFWHFFRVFASRGTSGANSIKIWDMPFPNYFVA